MLSDKNNQINLKYNTYVEYNFNDKVTYEPTEILGNQTNYSNNVSNDKSKFIIVITTTVSAVLIILMVIFISYKFYVKRNKQFDNSYLILPR